MILHGWKPEFRFSQQLIGVRRILRTIILYVLALGSPTFPIDPKGYQNWTSTFKWVNIQGIEYIHAGPLFITPDVASLAGFSRVSRMR